MDKQICKLSTISGVCLGVFIIGAFLAGILSANLDEQYHSIAKIIRSGAYLCGAVSLILAVGALIKISLSNGYLSGRTAASLVIVMCFIIGFLGVVISGISQSSMLAFRLMCSHNLKGLGTALNIYAFDYDDKLPSENWCDVLVMEYEVWPNSFICRASDNRIGESSYAMNKNAVGKKLDELPDDMVVLFEIDDEREEGDAEITLSSRLFAEHSEDADVKGNLNKVRKKLWNQVGGAELIPEGKHRTSTDGCSVLFADGRAEFVHDEKIPLLRWTVEDGDVSLSNIPKSIDKGVNWLMIILCVFSVVVAVGAIWLVWVIDVKKCWRGAILVGIASGGVGAFFGAGAQSLYNLVPSISGVVAGAAGGIIVGICYMSILSNMRDRFTDNRYLWDFSAALGMAAGIVCSTIVHVVLFILSDDKIAIAIAVGMPFGVFAGGVLGRITGAFMKPKTQGIENG